jgi:hypothetical protein
MQPEDQKSDFRPPQDTNYFSSAPVENTEEAGNQDAPAVTPVVEPSPGSQKSTAQPSAELPDAAAVQWQAPEYLHHEKNPLWYVGFGIVVLLLTVAAVFLIQSWTFALLIPVMAAALIAYSRRPPHVMSYALSGKGIYINDTLHPFAEFKGFGVIHEEEEYSVVFIPIRRFRPSLTVYFPEENGEAIVDLLGVRLPMQPLKLDAFDKIVRMLGL